MFKIKILILSSIFIFLLIITSVIKNKTRLLEKQITNLNIKILSKKKNINEAQLEFFYLTSPAEIEKKLNLIGFNKYYPITQSRIFSDISDFTKIKNKISNLKNLNEEKHQKKQKQ